MGRLTAQIKKDIAGPIPRNAALFLVIAGVFMGTVFTVGVRYWEAPVTKDNAVSVNAVFSFCAGIYRRGRLAEIIVRFEDHEPLTMDGVCLSDEVSGRVEAIKAGTVLNLYVHPNSGTILEMAANGEVILGFDEATAHLSAEVTGFAILGALMYLGAAFGLFKLIRKGKKNGKRI